MATPTIPTDTDTSVELVNRLLRLPDTTKADLAHLLLDSVKEGFTSLEEAESRDKTELRRRLDAVDEGPKYDAFEVVAEMRKMLAERRQLAERYRK
jgi:hypothetical protein